MFSLIEINSILVSFTEEEEQMTKPKTTAALGRKLVQRLEIIGKQDTAKKARRMFGYLSLKRGSHIDRLKM